MKKIAWFDGTDKLHCVLGWRRWYICLPFIKLTKAVDHPVIWADFPPKWFGKFPIMFTSDLIIAPFVANGKIMPIVYRREK